MRITKWILGFALLSGVVTAATAQTMGITPTLTGHVTDRSGAFVPEANVTVQQAGALVTKTQTDKFGAFSFVGAEGMYTVSVSSSPYFAPSGAVSKSFSVNKPAEFILNIAYVGGGVEVNPGYTSSSASPPVLASPHSAIPTSPVKDAAKRNWEYGALVQGGNGITDDRNDFHFLSAGGHVGRVLTDEIGTGMLKGNFEYAVEVFPFWQSYTPKFQRRNCYAVPTAGATLTGPGLYCTGTYQTGGTYTGVSVTPIILRWNFTNGTKWMPWVQGAGGVVWTNHKYPGFPAAGAAVNLNNDGPAANASVFNFTPQFGVGTHYFVKARRSIDFSVNAVHISSASLGDKNPGVNATIQATVGYTWWK